MKIDPQLYLDLLENANKLLFFDIESTGLKGDYNSIICVSFKPYGKKPFSVYVDKVGDDKKLVIEARGILEEYPCWVSYYGKGFDIPMINSRLLRWEELPIQSRHHIDMYYMLKAHTVTSSRSMGHMANWLGTTQQKLSVPPNTWSEMGFKLKEHLPMMLKRCESDTAVLEAVYKKTRHLIKDIKLQS